MPELRRRFRSAADQAGQGMAAPDISRKAAAFGPAHAPEIWRRRSGRSHRADSTHSAGATLTFSRRRRNRALDFAKADAITVTLAPAAHDQRIAVFQKCPLDAAGKFDRLDSVPADFKQAAALVLPRTADGAAPQQIADIHGAT